MSRYAVLAVTVCCGVSASPVLSAVVTDFSAGTIAPGTSSYFLDATMTPAGTYNVVTFDTLHPSWADFFDHTSGDAAGKFMVLNGASGSGGGIGWQVANFAVTPGTDYEVSAWFASVYGFATATLRFVVIGDTTMNGPGFGAPQVTSTWAQSSFAFNSGLANSVTIQIWDITGVGDGNDYAIDDIELNVVPGPTAAVLVLGAGALGVKRRRRGM